MEELSKDFKCEIIKTDFEFQVKASYYLKIFKGTSNNQLSRTLF